MTTQTAIGNFNPSQKALDRQGNPFVPNFRKFVENCRETGLLLILDEAHHAPAYGCRHLLMDIKNLCPNLQILGLTATPTYTDKTMRGWLKVIFDREVVYSAKQADLIAADILAKPIFIPKPTGRDYEVDDKLYDRLMREHKDLPEPVIARLAEDHERNDYIVHEYDKDKYGKTIIFADRWFQCVYLKEKLLKKGIKADAVYSHIDADPGSVEARNKRTSDDNKRILEQFKKGQGDDFLDVLINVRMLTEGTDVPAVKTVFVTRQTTSSTLMTQMIGRALRGKKAGGGSDKTEANIVLFVDNWKRLINWAAADLEGGVGGGSPVRGYYPLEYISIRLVEEVCKQIDSGSVVQYVPFSTMLPVGWYQTQIVVDSSEGQNQEIQSFTEFVMVYKHTKDKFEQFITDISANLSDEWAREELCEDWVRPQIQEWTGRYFDPENDNIGNTLDLDVTRIARHVAQTQSPPTYYAFEEREQYDLDKWAEKFIDERLDMLGLDDRLEDLFSTPGGLWKTFYKTPDRFKTAFWGAQQRVIGIRKGIKNGNSTELPPLTQPPRELTEEEKWRIKHRDGNRCLACGGHGRGVRLEIDHITPVKFGGLTTEDNSQTLCRVCNQQKAINEINFRINTSLLPSPKELTFPPRNDHEDVRRSITRLVNFFYHCQAVSSVHIHERTHGSYYSCWEIGLFSGNNPQWLLQNKPQILKYIQEAMGWSHVTDFRIK